MCGGLVVAATEGEKKSSHAAYHLARLSGYLLVGGLAGRFGSAILETEDYRRVATGAGLLIGLSFLALAYRAWRGQKEIPFVSSLLSPVVRRLAPRAIRLPGRWRSAATGFLSVGLPCGWLYSFILAAIATHDSTKGMLLLFTFWLGTLPALAVGGWGIRKWASRWEGKRHRGVALAFLALGLFTVYEKMDLLVRTESAAPKEVHHCHED